MNRRIAFFDFDGTITAKDTLLEIIRYRHGTNKLSLGFLLHSHYLVAFKLGIISNQTAKEKMLRYFFRGFTVEQFQELSDQFAASEIPALVRPKALVEIKKLQEAGFEVVVVSASAENWIRKWCESVRVKLIATKLAVKDGRITGKIEGKNCHGKEKVNQVKAKYDLSEFSDIYCYGDTSGDKPMLGLGTRKFYKPFR